MTIEDDSKVEGEIKKQRLPGGKYVVMRAEDRIGRIWSCGGEGS